MAFLRLKIFGLYRPGEVLDKTSVKTPFGGEMNVPRKELNADVSVFCSYAPRGGWGGCWCSGDAGP